MNHEVEIQMGPCFTERLKKLHYADVRRNSRLSKYYLLEHSFIFRMLNENLGFLAFCSALFS